ncbi:MAG: heme ABC exporter ATP-binding protein CcmA [Chloroflexi bacterium]|nr:heme ABC exporter ATP-binding protein CcmA [Chloroflexota bacterium]
MITPTEPESLAVQVGGLTKSFGAHPVLRGVDLEIRKGEFLAIFGPNGAGKTTLLKVVSTVMTPTGGSVHVDGVDLAVNPSAARRRIGVMSHQTLLYDDLTVLENLSFYGRMYDVHPLRERIDDLVGQVGMRSRLHDRVRTLSRGMQQRVALARALLHDPSILLLDEPETGLDQEALALLDKMVRARAGRTVLMTTHNLDRGLQMGSRAVIMVQGKIVHQEAKPTLDVASFCETYRTCAGGGS